jgi:hypothetical protein
MRDPPPPKKSIQANKQEEIHTIIDKHNNEK